MHGAHASVMMGMGGTPRMVQPLPHSMGQRVAGQPLMVRLAAAPGACGSGANSPPTSRQGWESPPAAGSPPAVRGQHAATGSPDGLIGQPQQLWSSHSSPSLATHGGGSHMVQRIVPEGVNSARTEAATFVGAPMLARPMSVPRIQGINVPVMSQAGSPMASAHASPRPGETGAPMSSTVPQGVATPVPSIVTMVAPGGAAAAAHERAAGRPSVATQIGTPGRPSAGTPGRPSVAPQPTSVVMHHVTAPAASPATAAAVPSPTGSAQTIAPPHTGRSLPEVHHYVPSRGGSLTTPADAAEVARRAALDAGSAVTMPSASGAGDEAEIITCLRSEIGDLRQELDTLRGLLRKSAPADDHQHSPGVSAKLDALQRKKADAEAQLRESHAEAQWLRQELLKSRGIIDENGEVKVRTVPGRPKAQARDEEQEESNEPTPQSSWAPPIEEEEMDADRLGPLRAQSQGSAHNQQSTSSLHRGAEGSDGSSDHEYMDEDRPRSHNYPYASPPPGGFSGADRIDEMWCAVLQRFPQFPHWALVKEKPGVYRMGSAEGRKLFCRISRGGLQVRVGGGWMGAVPFMAKYGRTGMGPGPNCGYDDFSEGMSGPTGQPCSGASRAHLKSMLDVPPSMERLLVPTKSWAQRIGVSKTRDLREARG